MEAYNQGLNAIHTLFNTWDGLTRTERRTRATIKQVVGTVEQAMQTLAVALTDALPAQEGEECLEMEGEWK